MGMGRAELPRSHEELSHLELEVALWSVYPDLSPDTIANYTCQVWKFVNTTALVPDRAPR